MSLEVACAHTGIRCLAAVARLNGIATTREQLLHDHVLGNQEPAVPKLVSIAQSIGLRAKAKTLVWNDLFRLGDAFPIIIRLKNGNMMVAAGVTEKGGTRLLLLQDPLAEDADVLVLDEQRFTDAWDGTAIFIKRQFEAPEQERPFNLAWFLPEIRRHRRLFRDIAIASVLMGLMAVALPVFTQLVIDKVLLHRSLDTLYVLVAGMVFVVAFETVFTYVRQFLTLFVTNKIDAHVNVQVFNKLTSLPIDFFERNSAGVILKNVSQSERIRSFLTGQLFVALLDAVLLVIFIPLLFFYSPILACVVLVFTALISICSLLTIPIIRSRLREVYEVEARQQSFLVETIQGMRTVKTLALDARQRHEWEGRVGRTIRVRFNVAKLAILLGTLTSPLERLMILSVIGGGAYLVLNGEMMVGALIAFNMISGRVTHPLVQISHLLQQFQEVSLSVGMLGTIMNHPSEQGRTGHGLRLPFRGEVAFQNVRFRYAGGATPALDSASFSIPAGTIFGIVGRSGSGKTTVTRLLQGLHAIQEGLIKIDGHDLREIDLDHLRSSIGVVLQESFLFTGSIRDNIAVGRPSATTSDILRALRLAGADEFVERLPGGLNTLLEEGASNLSGGQRQRLAIARALLRDPPILILDEATSALDAESEAIIQANLMNIAHGRTLIIVSHRLSTLVPANNIMVLDQGRVNDIGNHGELLDRCAIYRNLWRQQNRHVVDMDYREGSLS
jgi:ATP-binding cassette, subfamily B, bacterial HlyB/CyaB